MKFLSYALPPDSSRLNWNWNQQGSYEFPWPHNGVKILNITGNDGTSTLTLDGHAFTENGLYIGIDNQWREW